MREHGNCICEPGIGREEPTIPAIYEFTGMGTAHVKNLIGILIPNAP